MTQVYLVLGYKHMELCLYTRTVFFFSAQEMFMVSICLLFIATIGIRQQCLYKVYNQNSVPSVLCACEIMTSQANERSHSKSFMVAFCNHSFGRLCPS